MTEHRNEILVGVDGSPASDAAVAWAASEARRRGTCLVIFHVEPPTYGRLKGFARRRRGRPIVRAARRIARRAEAGVTVRTVVATGSVLGRLVEMSRHAGLIVVGRGVQRAAPGAVGSMPRQLIAAAHCPVITVPAGQVLDPESETGHIVVAVDNGYRRENQIAFAFEEAARHGMPVEILHVDAGATEPDWPDRLLHETALARDIRPWLRLSVNVRDGSLEQAVASTCESGDLLVLSQHHLHVVTSNLGSRIEGALQAAPCAVAVVREATVAHRPAFTRSLAGTRPSTGAATALHPMTTQQRREDA